MVSSHPLTNENQENWDFDGSDSWNYVHLQQRTVTAWDKNRTEWYANCSPRYQSAPPLSQCLGATHKLSGIHLEPCLSPSLADKWHASSVKLQKNLASISSKWCKCNSPLMSMKLHEKSTLILKRALWESWRCLMLSVWMCICPRLLPQPSNFPIPSPVLQCGENKVRSFSEAWHFRSSQHHAYLKLSRRVLWVTGLQVQ